jgi:ATP-dependent DNA helicase RecG
MALKYAKGIPDPIPTQILANRSLPSLSIAVKQLHFPSSKPALAKATERLAYEESLVQQLAIAQNRLERQKYSAPEIPFDQKVIKKLVANLPFVLTLDQKKTLWQILQDLEFKAPMNRLLLGDVGSGKTIVSFLAALETALSGSQVAFLVPTEILAMQHYANFCLLLKKFKIPLNTLFLYTASKHQHGQKTLTKNSLHKKLATTSSGVIIGTHALLQEKVQFQKLSFVVIDEQHRFGVKQRSHLLKQLDQIDKTKYTIPHLLSMSATPIPRTSSISTTSRQGIPSAMSVNSSIVTSSIKVNIRNFLAFPSLYSASSLIQDFSSPLFSEKILKIRQYSLHSL